MKIFYMIFIIFLILTVSSCLTYRVAEYTIEFSETFNSGTITVKYSDVRSSEDKEEKRKKDFTELIELFEQDKFLLDQIEDGVYVKDRHLFEKNGQINAEYSGIFDNLKIDGNELKSKNEERILLLSTDDGEVIESNGKIYLSEHNILLVWPNDQKILTFKRTLKNYEERSYSFIDYYQNWKR